jgi:hypothetical protein
MVKEFYFNPFFSCAHVFGHMLRCDNLEVGFAESACCKNLKIRDRLTKKSAYDAYFSQEEEGTIL